MTARVGKEKASETKNWIHPTDEHVMPIDHVAKDCQGVDDRHSVAEHRFAHIGNQNMRDDSHAGHDRDIHLGMSEEPEKVLPEEASIRGCSWSLMTILLDTKSSFRNMIQDQEMQAGINAGESP